MRKSGSEGSEYPQVMVLRERGKVGRESGGVPGEDVERSEEEWASETPREVERGEEGVDVDTVGRVRGVG